MKLFLVLFLAITAFTAVASGQEPQKLLISVNLQTGESQAPIISGMIKNESGEPIQDVAVQISSNVGTAEVKSDTNGIFVYSMLTLPDENKINISIKAQKEGYQAGYANTSFFVNDNPQSSIQTKPVNSSFKVVTTDKIKNDPIASKILQNIELSKQKEEKKQKRLQEIEEQQKFIEQQREIANQNLLNDLQVFFEQFDPFKPRNVFSSFVSQFDTTIQTIYWAQFNFTEAKTREGYVALEQVLNNGGTMEEARKAFYEKAATPQSELNKLNDDLNAKYAKNDTRSRPD
jgi:hypothetical protein